MPNLYALLVAINNYPPNVPSLRGCLNDGDAMERVLRSRFSSADLQLLRLNDADATRANVIQSFRSHLGKASKDDIALFFYAGHGSQVPNNGLFQNVDPGTMNQSIVLYDSRTPGGLDLVDKDIATLIEEVTAKGVHLTAIFDSCHSGAIDRGLPLETDAPQLATRSIPARSDAQPAEQYLRAVVEDAASSELTLTSVADYVPDESGLHILMAACKDSQVAQEYLGAGTLHGAFTWFLTQALANAKTPLGYRGLMLTVTDAMNGRVAQQTPKLESAGSDAIFDNLFLGLEPTPWSDYAHAFFGITGVWQLDRGEVLGVAAGDRYAMYPLDATPADMNDPAKALGTVAVTAATPSAATIQPDAGLTLDTGLHYKAVATAASALDHVAMWKKWLALTNPATQIPASAIDFIVTVYPGAANQQMLHCPPAAGVELSYSSVAAGQVPAYTATIQQNFASDLYIAALVFSEDYSISTALLPAGTQPLSLGQSIGLLGGQSIHCSIPAAQSESTDQLLLVVSTDWFDSTLFRLSPLDPNAGPTRSAPVDATPQHDFFTRRIPFHTSR